jgi:NTE family protein
MGALIGSLCAFGKNSQEIEKIASEINYLTLLDPDLSAGLIAGKKIHALLRKLFGDVRIEESPIPLRIIATNFDTGMRTIFRKDLLIDALRASISIPGVIHPYAIKNTLYVDGGITDNLPIDALDHDKIVAVSVLRDIDGNPSMHLRVAGKEFSTGIVGKNYRILQKSIDIMMRQNEKHSLALPKNIIAIEPLFPEFDYLEFHRVHEIVMRGYETAKNEKLIERVHREFSL